MGPGKMLADQPLHPRPCPAVLSSLTATPDHPEPVASHLVHKASDAVAVARHGMIVQPSLHHSPQPSGGFAQWPVHPFAQCQPDRLQLHSHPFRNRMPMDGETPVLPRPGTLMCKTQEIKSLRLPPTTPASSVRIASEFYQACFPIMQLQPKLGETRPEILQTRQRLIMRLESDHKIIRVANDDHFSATATFAPLLHP